MKDFFIRHRKKFFFTFLIVFVATYFFQSNYRGIDDPDPQLFEEPSQIKILNPEPIIFQHGEIEYELSPLYEYELTGLVVNRMVYDKWYSLHESDEVFAVDLCMIWGSNVENRVYQEEGLDFSQDMRFCWFKWDREVDVNLNEISNSHLVISEEKMRKMAESVMEGDQVRIIGKLVNVEARNAENQNKYANWNSSTVRTDTSGGACEIIYVEEIEIIKSANPLFRLLHRFSLYGAIFMMFFEVALLFWEASHPEKRKKL